MDKQESNEQYHADTWHVSKSMLQKLETSPRVYEATYLTKTIPPKAKSYFTVGSAVHCMALEPAEFSQRYATCPERVNKTRKAFKDFAKDNTDKDVLSWSEHETVSNACIALGHHPRIAQLLAADGVIEQSIRYECPLTGLKCKWRPDKVIPAAKVVFDIKTVDTLSLRLFARQCDDFGYALQDAHYRMGAVEEFGGDLQEWAMLFGVVETKPPHRARLVQLDGESQQQGMDDRERLLIDWNARQMSGDWSDIDEHEIATVQLPSIRWRR